jgi:DNA-binding transcriptional ArsR family regulator
MSRQLDDTFQALADPTRRQMLAMLTRGESTAGELGRPFAISQPAASKHLRVLEQAGLVRRRREGRVHRFRLNPDPLAQAEQWLNEQRAFWNAALDNLERFLDQFGGEAPDRPKPSLKTPKT